MKKIIATLILLATPIFFGSCRNFQNEANAYFESWDSEIECDVVLAYQFEDEYIRIGERDIKYNEAIKNSCGREIAEPLCIIDNCVYGVIYINLSEEENRDFRTKWILIKSDLDSNAVTELCESYCAKRDGTERVPKKACYRRGEIYIADGIKTTVYNISTGKASEKPLSSYGDFEYTAWRIFDGSGGYELSNSKENRIITFDYIADRHSYVSDLEEHLKNGDKRFNRRTKELFINGVYVIEDNFYFDCAVFNYTDTSATHILLYYEWEGDKFYYISTLYDYGGRWSNFMFPVYKSNTVSE